MTELSFGVACPPRPDRATIRSAWPRRPNASASTSSPPPTTPCGAEPQLRHADDADLDRRPHQPDQGRQPGAGRAVPPPGHGGQAGRIAGPARPAAGSSSGSGRATPTKRSPRSAARRCPRPRRSTAWPRPSRSSAAPGRDPATPRTGATTASATSRWNPGLPSPSRSGWAPSARARSRSPAGWPTAGSPRSATGRRRSFPRCGAGSTAARPPAGGRRRSAACSTWPSASIRPPGRSQTWSPAQSAQVVSQLRDLLGLGFTGFNFLLRPPSRPTAPGRRSPPRAAPF